MVETKYRKEFPSEVNTYIAAFKVTLDDSAVLCRYYDDAIGNNYESEDAAINDWDTYIEKSDDEYLTSLGDASWNVIPYDADNDNLFDAGIIAEAGFGYSFNGSGELQIIVRYQYSLTDLDKNYQKEPN